LLLILPFKVAKSLNIFVTSATNMALKAGSRITVNKHNPRLREATKQQGDFLNSSQTSYHI